jgi:hypothetical protein
MCTCAEDRSLSFETLLTDPMTRLVMESDGVSLTDLITVLMTARAAVDRAGADEAPVWLV